MIERIIPKFEPTISLGHILTVIAMLAAIVGAWGHLESEQNITQFRIAALEKSITTIADIVKGLAEKTITDARQSDRLDSNDRRLDKIEEYARETRARLHTIESIMNVPIPKKEPSYSPTKPSYNQPKKQ